MQAVQDCEKLAYDYGHQEIAQEHLLYSLLRDGDGLIPKLFAKMEIDTEVFLAQVTGLLKKRPRVEGGQVYISNDLNKVRTDFCVNLLIFMALLHSAQNRPYGRCCV